MESETKQKILDATERLIGLKGLARVTTRDIARETGLSEGAIYRHFDHKEDIFLALLAKYLPALHQTLQAHPAGSGTIQENLSALALAAVRHYERLHPLSSAFLADAQLLEQFRSTLQLYHLGPQNLVMRFAAYIEQEQHLNRIGRQIPAVTVATLLLGPCFQYAFMHNFTGTVPFGTTDQQFVEELVQGLIAGIHPS